MGAQDRASKKKKGRRDGKEQVSRIPNYVKFICSGIAGCSAAAVCHPIDVVKGRMQLSGEWGAQRAHKTSVHALINIANNEGMASLYKGMSANMARQLAYTTTRLGFYQIILPRLTEMGVTGVKAQIGAGLLSGFIAAACATPTDVALVRMMGDNRLPPDERRNYKNVFDAITRIYSQEGVKGLWTGVTPTVLRATAGNVTQIVTYVQFRDNLVRRGFSANASSTHFIASVLSGFCYAFGTAPLDVGKTRLQAMKLVEGKPQYSGLKEVYLNILRKEGFTALWKGFGPYYLKIAPNTVLLFMINEKLLQAYQKHVLKEDNPQQGF